MKVTKYPQSCLLLEKDGRRIVIDPGSFFAQKYSLDELGELQAVLYTHQHADHLDEGLVAELKGRSICLYGNADVCAKIGEGACEVKSGSGITVAGFAIMPHDLPHFPPPNGSLPPQNTGYIIDGTFFHPGDGLETEKITVESLAAPVGNPKGFEGALELARSLGVKRVLPIHYTNQELFPLDINEFAELAGSEFEVVTLPDGASAEF